MAANTSLQAESPATGRTALTPVTGAAWLGGFANLFRKELGDWVGTWRWLIQSVIWLGILDGFLAFSLFVVPEIIRTAPLEPGQPRPPVPGPLELGLPTYFSLAGLAGAIGVIILVHDTIIGEKQSGTAAWILSKPVARPAFILAKLVADTLGIAVFILGLPAVVAYGLLWIAVGSPLAVPAFLAGLGLLGLVYLFYLTFCLMLGTLFTSRGPALGIALGLLLGGGIVGGLVSQVEQVIPDMLPKVAGMLTAGQPLPAVATWPILTTVAWSVLFLAVALWRFARQEI